MIMNTTINTETYENDEDIHEYFALRNRLVAFNEEQKEKILGNDGILELSKKAGSDTDAGSVKDEHWEADPYEYKLQYRSNKWGGYQIYRCCNGYGNHYGYHI